MNKIEMRNELFVKLKKEFSGTGVEARPYSPKKYATEESTAINIVIPALKPEKTIVCGMEIQERRGPYKVWFNTHPEWETITKCEVKSWATNNAGIGSGNGFYLDSLNAVVQEVKDYVQKYYSDFN